MHAKVLIIVACLAQLLPTPPQERKGPENLEVRYARAQTQLAEANLKRVEQRNKRVARSVPSSVVAEYERDVGVAKTRLEQAAAGRATNEFQVWLQRAEAEHKAADTAWKNAIAANGHMSGTFDALDIERYRLRAEVAKLQLERGQMLADSDREAQSQWKIDLLDNQVQRLKEESRRTTTSVHYYPSWPW